MYNMIWCNIIQYDILAMYNILEFMLITCNISECCAERGDRRQPRS